MFVSFDFLCSCFPLFCCKQMCLEAVDCWLWTSSVPIWKMNKTVVVAGCVIAGSAQLLKPCHIHHIPQTGRQADEAGSQSGTGGMLRGGCLVWGGIGVGAFCMYLCQDNQATHCRPLSLFTINLHVQQQHALPVNMSTYTVYSPKHAGSERFIYKPTQTNTRRIL